MRKIKSLVLLLLAGVSCTSTVEPERIHVKAEPLETTELFSVMMMLTGAYEYNQPAVWMEYKEIVNTYFEPYKDHPSIEFIKSVSNFRGDGPMWVAVNTEIKDGDVIIHWTKDHDNYLDKEIQKQLSTEIDKFYKDTGFRTFFETNKHLYDPLTESFNTHFITNIDLNWLNAFFGANHAKEYKAVLNYLNGPLNFGPDCEITGEPIPTPIFGIYDREEFMTPDQEFIQSTLATVLHEYLHSYCNPLIFQFYNELAPVEEVIFPDIQARMKRIGYGLWKTVLCEAFVRASVIAYMRSNDYFENYVNEEIAKQKERGFYWVPALSDLLAEYENNRDTYPTMESFMPRMAEFYHHLAEEVQNREVILEDL